MKRLTIAVAIAAAAMPTTACSPTPAETEAPAQPTAAFEAAEVREACGRGSIIPMIEGINASDPLANAALCGDVQRGQMLGVLSGPDHLEWDRACVAATGYTLTKGPDDAEVLESADPNHYAPQEVAHCATPKFTADQCTEIQNGLGAVDSGADVRGIVMGDKEAAVLHQLGCSIPPVVRPGEQAGIAESQR